MNAVEYDIIVVGGGPSGTATALHAANAGLNVLLLDKTSFPRDKVCGDALSRESVTQLQTLGVFDKIPTDKMVKIYRGRCFAPDFRYFDVDLRLENNDPDAFLHICSRLTLDHVLLTVLKEKATVYENFKVTDLSRVNGCVNGVIGFDSSGLEKSFTAKVVVGADGAGSIVARKSGLYQQDAASLSFATRQYFSGIEMEQDRIEIYFFKDVLPGYFWIFPAGDGRVNVGLVTLHENLIRRGNSIRTLHESILQSDLLRDRFRNAKELEKVRGWRLPLASRIRRNFGDGLILVGDAAGLIDPASGEGIGNALRSAKIAGQFLAKVCRGNVYDQEVLREYSALLYREINKNELKFHYRLQRLSDRPWILNFLIGRAAAWPGVLSNLTGIIRDTELESRKKILSPFLFFKK